MSMTYKFTKVLCIKTPVEKKQIIKYNIHMIKLKVVNPKNSEVVQFFKWFFEEKIKIEDSIVDFFFFKQRLELWAHYWDDTVYV